ncbi:MAG: hypothetical protein ACJ734_10090 [Gaiellaceae bacterium]
MKHRVFALLALMIAALALTGSALAFDCIRVSSSLQGLQQSTRSGNWLLFDLSSASAVQETAARAGEEVTAQQAACVADAYAESGLSPYFALGIGVAGPNGVLAGHNKNDKALSNLKGIDHLEDSPVGAAFIGALGECGLE